MLEMPLILDVFIRKSIKKGIPALIRGLLNGSRRKGSPSKEPKTASLRYIAYITYIVRPIITQGVELGGK